jgi:hypothetical protein
MEGIRLAGGLVGNAFTGLNTALTDYDTAQKGQAASALLQQAMGYHDPAALRAAVANGSVFNGIDRTRLTPEALASLNTQVNALLTQAAGQQNLEKGAFELGVAREDRASDIAARPDVARMFGMTGAAANLPVDTQKGLGIGRANMNQSNASAGLSSAQAARLRDEIGDTRAGREAANIVERVIAGTGGSGGPEGLNYILNTPEIQNPRIRSLALAGYRAAMGPSAFTDPLAAPAGATPAAGGGAGANRAGASIAAATTAPTVNDALGVRTAEVIPNLTARLGQLNTGLTSPVAGLDLNSNDMVQVVDTLLKTDMYKGVSANNMTANLRNIQQAAGSANMPAGMAAAIFARNYVPNANGWAADTIFRDGLSYDTAPVRADINRYLSGSTLEDQRQSAVVGRSLEQIQTLNQRRGEAASALRAATRAYEAAGSDPVARGVAQSRLTAATTRFNTVTELLQRTVDQAQGQRFVPQASIPGNTANTPAPGANRAGGNISAPTVTPEEAARLGSLTEDQYRAFLATNGGATAIPAPAPVAAPVPQPAPRMAPVENPAPQTPGSGASILPNLPTRPAPIAQTVQPSGQAPTVLAPNVQLPSAPRDNGDYNPTRGDITDATNRYVSRMTPAQKELYARSTQDAITARRISQMTDEEVAQALAQRRR